MFVMNEKKANDVLQKAELELGIIALDLSEAWFLAKSEDNKELEHKFAALADLVAATAQRMRSEQLG